ncbi:MAG: protein kinase [Acidobacteriota bacterium]
MIYCKDCLRFISGNAQGCPYCGSVNSADIRLINSNDREIKDIDINVNQIILNQKVFNVDRLIGVGGYGTILKVKEESGGKNFALKVPLTFNNDFTSEGGYNETEIRNSENSISGEISIVKRIKSEKVVKVIDTGSCLCRNDRTSKKFPAILLELAMGTLRDLILMEVSGKVKISFEEKLEISRQIIDNLKDIHDMDIVHRDIALENIFVVERNNRINYVFADFGTSKYTGHQLNEKTTKVIGREKYLDPARYMKKYRRDPRIDMFTAGIVITEVLIGDLWDNIIYEPLSEIDFEKEFLKNYASAYLDKRFIKFIAKSLKPEIENRYKDTDEMKKNFNKIAKTPGNKIKYKKVTRLLNIIYNMKIPFDRVPFQKKKFINFETHNKINLDINERTIIKFNGELIDKVKLIRLPFFKVKIFDSGVEIVLNEKMLDKEFGIFKREGFENDRGILYFQGQMKINCRIRLGTMVN